MKNVRLFLLLFLISGVIFSCEEILENNRLKEEQENQISPYMGRWVGTYTGSENGNLVLDIKKSGSVEVIRTINNTQDVYYTNVYGGVIYNTPSPNSGFVLSGNMGSHSGTWKMGAGSGNWSVTKQ